MRTTTAVPRCVLWLAVAAGLSLAVAGCGAGTVTAGAAPRVTLHPLPPSPPAAPSAPAPHGAMSPNAPRTANGPVPRPDHVVIVIFENKGYGSQVGSSEAPFLNSVLGRAAVFTNAHAITHPSQPNYLALFSGSVQGVTSDRCLSPFHHRPNLASQLLAAGDTFAGYSEDLPSVGYAGCTHGDYAAKHNPWVHFDNVPSSVNRPFTAFPGDFDALPTVSFVVPNLCNDMHNCATATGDRWARTHLGPYLDWAGTHRSLLLITYDENDGGAGNQILTAVAGAGVRPGRYAERVDHYRVLRTIEAMYGLAPIENAADTSPITDIWK